MKTRIITAAIGIPILLIILFLFPLWAFTIVITLICLLAAYELLKTVQVNNKAMLAISYITAAVIPALTYLAGFNVSVISILVFFAAMFVVGFYNMDTVTFDKICYSFFGAYVLPVCLTGILRISMMENSIYFILTPFVIAWSSDSLAYFVGMKLGKHKLCPSVSPKKTIEGALGGIAGGIIGTVIMCMVLRFGFHINIHFGMAAILGAVGSLISQVGDLSMSLIKRNFNVKDYGKIMPGHGGILDRFDSVIFIIPVVEVLLSRIHTIL